MISPETKQDQVMSFRCDDGLMSLLNAVCEREGLRPSAAIRKAIIVYVQVSLKTKGPGNGMGKL